MNCYLAGPIGGCTDEEVFGWRREAARLLAPFGVLDPTRRDYRGRELDLSNREVRQLVDADLDDIKACDAVLLNAWKPGWGTISEAVYSKLWGKPVVVVWPRGKPTPWCRYHATRIVTTVADGVGEIKRLLRAG